MIGADEITICTKRGTVAFVTKNRGLRDHMLAHMASKGMKVDGEFVHARKDEIRRAGWEAWVTYLAA